MIGAVITGDIVHSTGLDADSEKKLLRALKRVLQPYLHEFYRGDSFQAYLKDASQALKVLFLLRCVTRRIDEQGIGFDLKTSLGISNVKTPIRQLATAKGDAFLLSGRQFDAMDWNIRRTVISTGQQPTDIALELLSNFADDLFERMTYKQAAVIFELLNGKKQEQIAKHFNKSQSTISQQVTGGGWHKLVDLLAKFDQLIQLLKP